MQPYEIRQLPDGSIDYNQYYARPIRLLTPAMRKFMGALASPATLLTIAATAAIVALASPLLG